MKTFRKLSPYIYIMPFLSIFVVFLAVPIVQSFTLSFYKVTLYTDWYHIFDDMSFTGLGNYTELLMKDTEFRWSLVLTLAYALLTIPINIGLSLVLAVLLLSKIRGRIFFRSAIFLPNILDILIIGIIWTFIYSPIYGLIDAVLSANGIQPPFEKGLLGNPWTTLPAISVAMVLKNVGFGMILFMASLANITPSIFESAAIDGVSFYGRIRYIIIPLVKPVIFFLVITGLMGTLNAFAEIYAMTDASGGPPVDVWGETVKSASVVGFYLFKHFERGEYGYTAAMSFILLVIAVVVSVINAKWLKLTN